MKKSIHLMMIGILILSGTGNVASPIKNIKTEMKQQVITLDDFDPLVDIAIKMNVTALRSLDTID